MGEAKKSCPFHHQYLTHAGLAAEFRCRLIFRGAITGERHIIAFELDHHIAATPRSFDGFVAAAAAGTLIGIAHGGLDAPARGLMVW